MTDERILRLNELAKKYKSGVPLTEAELAERDALRKEYVAAFRESLRAQLDNTYIQTPSEGMIYIDNVGFAANALEGYENKEIAMVEIAPEKVQIVNPQDAKLTGTTKSCMFLGTHYQITVSCEENDWIAHSEEFMEDGEEVGILVDAQDLILTDKKE